MRLKVWLIVLTWAGLVTLAIQYYNLSAWPDLEELVWNEITSTSQINQDTEIKIRHDIQAVMQYTTGAYTPDLSRLLPDPPRIKKAKALAGKSLRLTDSLTTWFDRLRAAPNQLERDHLLTRMQTVLADTLFDPILNKRINQVLMSLNKPSTISDYALAVLHLENQRAHAYDVMEAYLDSLQAAHGTAGITLGGAPSGSIAAAKMGLIAFHPPTTMELEQRYRIQVKISKDLQADLVKQLSITNGIQDSILVGEIMIVRLQGDNFKITPLDEEEQGVLDVGYTQWEFDVMPLSSGNQKLFVRAGIVYHVPNLGPTKKFFPVYEKEINIEISYGKRITAFMTQRWEFIVSSFVIPGMMWAYTQVRKRRRRTNFSRKKRTDSPQDQAQSKGTMLP